MKTKLLFTLLLFIGSISYSQVWDESVDGDLSDDGLNPSGIFNFAEGDNIIIASQQGNPRDVDFFAFTVPDGFELIELVVDDYESTDNVAFIGIDSGATTDVDFTNPSAGDLLGGTSYGTASIGNNILAVMGNLGGAEGFIPPLQEGTYTIWLNQTGAPSTSTLNFIVSQVLSIDENALPNDVNIFPNPASTSIQIAANQPVTKIQLFDVLGKEVKTALGTNNLDISNISKGVYLASITTDQGTITKKLIKQ